MKVLNFGSLNVDYVYKVDRMIKKGETLLTHGREVFPGGKGLNQSIALARAGLDVYHAGIIGTDGDILIETLEGSNVDTSNILRLTDTPSGHTIIQNDKDGDNCILLFGGTNRMVSKEHIDKTIEKFEPGDYIVLQNEINNLDYVIEKAHKKGMKIVFNPSPMEESILELPLEYIDFFFVNEIEAAQLTGVSEQAENTKLADKTNLHESATLIEESEPGVDSLCKGLLEHFPNAQIILTLGSRGSVYLFKDIKLTQPIYKTEAVDTTAAGDTFTGYFIASIIEGRSPAEALDIASRASSITVSRPGAAPSIPVKSEVFG